MISSIQAKRYCCEDISLIENYDKAVSDKSHKWHCHHRAEILPCGRFSKEDLKKYGLYWNVPASQLMFLTPSEHHHIHRIGKHNSEETRKKISDARKGIKFSEEHRRKLSEAKKGKLHPRWGKHVSEELRKKMSEGMKQYWESNKFSK